MSNVTLVHLHTYVTSVVLLHSLHRLLVLANNVSAEEATYYCQGDWIVHRCTWTGKGRFIFSLKPKLEGAKKSTTHQFQTLYIFGRLKFIECVITWCIEDCLTQSREIIHSNENSIPIYLLSLFKERGLTFLFNPSTKAFPTPNDLAEACVTRSSTKNFFNSKVVYMILQPATPTQCPRLPSLLTSYAPVKRSPWG